MANNGRNQGTAEPEPEKHRHLVFDTRLGKWIVYRVAGAFAWVWLILFLLKQRMLPGGGLSCHYLLLVPAAMWLFILFLGRKWRFILYPVYLLLFPIVVAWLMRRVIASIISMPMRVTRFASSSHFVLILVVMVCTGWIVTFSFGDLYVRAIASLSAHTAMYVLFLQSFRWAASPYKPLIDLMKWIGDKVGSFFEKTYVDPEIGKRSDEVSASVCGGVLKVINWLHPEQSPLEKGVIGFVRVYLVPLFILGFLVLYAVLASSFSLSFYEFERAFGPQIEGLAESPSLVDYLYFSFLSQATAVPDSIRAVSIFGQAWIVWIVMTGVLLVTALIAIFTTSAGIHAQNALDDLQGFLLGERNRYTEWMAMLTSDSSPETETVIEGEFKEVRAIQQSQLSSTVDVEPAVSQSAREDLVILSAEYGKNDIWKDVTRIVGSRVSGGQVRFLVDNTNLEGDPLEGIVKELRVAYSFSGETHTKTVPEHEELVLP